VICILEFLGTQNFEGTDPKGHLWLYPSQPHNNAIKTYNYQSVQVSV